MELEVKSPSIQDDFLEDGEAEEMSFQSNVKDYDEDIDSSSDFDFSE